MIKISQELLEAIKKSTAVAIVAHVKPDADALGSASALKQALMKMGKQADIFCDSEISDIYNFIKHVDTINKPSLKNYDTYISVDCGDQGRLGKYFLQFESCENSINIDHHATNTNYAKTNFVKDVSSTGEILFSLFNRLNVPIDIDIATALYAAISSDTGCFQHGNTSEGVHLIAAQLIKIGVNIERANYYLFKRRTKQQIALQQIALKNLTFYHNDKIALIYLRQKDLAACDIKSSDTNGLVDICINIADVEVGILIHEQKPNLYSCSLRSNRKVNVAEVAQVFGGGGHAYAAGCNIFGTCKTVAEKLVKESVIKLEEIEQSN